MDVQDLINDGESRSVKRSPMFDFTFNLGHVFIIISFLFTGGMFYADKESHQAVTDNKIEVLDAANLPTRVQALEVSATDLRDWMKQEAELLRQIRDKIDTKQDKPNK